jgi:ABC-type bacteriocin/lantibiotic exporter with double-glycine peptidase domain
VSHPIVSMTPQRHRADCGCACLAMLLGISYEDALLALGGEAPKILRDGIWLTELQRGALRLGVPLKVKRRWDVEADEGIAQIRTRADAHHVVVLRAGLFFDTDFSIWYPDDYLRAKKAKTGPLLVRGDE